MCTRMMVKMELGGMNLQNIQIHYLLKGKHRKIGQENEKARKKLKNPGQRRDVRPCIPPPRSMFTTTGRPWWCLALPFRRFPNAAFWCFFLVHRFCLGSSALGLLGLFCNLPWSSRPSTSFVSPITWLNICKYEIKNFEQAKTSVIGEIGA